MLPLPVLQMLADPNSPTGKREGLALDRSAHANPWRERITSRSEHISQNFSWNSLRSVVSWKAQGYRKKSLKWEASCETKDTDPKLGMQMLTIYPGVLLAESRTNYSRLLPWKMGSIALPGRLREFWWEPAQSLASCIIIPLHSPHSSVSKFQGTEITLIVDTWRMCRQHRNKDAVSL